MSNGPEWMAELLEEAERQEQLNLQMMNRRRADQILQLIRKLEVEADNVNSLSDEEVQLIEEFRTRQLSKIQKKIDWFVLNLSGFMNTQEGIKTLELPHGILKKRKSRERVEVTDLEKFLPEGIKFQLLRTVPEEHTPNALALLNYIKSTGSIPSGVTFIASEDRFSFTTLKKGESNESEQRESSKVGAELKRVSDSHLAA